MIHFLLFIITLLNPTVNNVHDHYISITTAKINNINHKLEISIKLTAHDVEYHFEKEKNIKLKLGGNKEFSDSDQLLSEYINKHLFFSIEDDILDLEFIGKETDLDETMMLKIIVMMMTVMNVKMIYRVRMMK